MLVIVGAAMNDVAPAPVLYGICRFVPPAMFVAVVAKPAKLVAVNVLVLGVKLNLLEDVVAPVLPVVTDAITGYQVEDELVLSVIAIFVAFVAVVAVVAEPAEPSMFVPVKLIEADALFSATAVVPI